MSVSNQWLAGEAARRPAAWWLAAVRREERRGELLGAFDLAERGLIEHPHDVALKHRAVLALARTGATEEAARRFDEYGLSASSDEDVSALRARIAKDAALACEGQQRRHRASFAAELYNAIFARTGGFYPAINAATLWLLAGHPDRARRLAECVLEILARTEDRTYWAAATEAEARLVRGEQSAVRQALGRAASLHDGDYAALATTRRQLRTICEVQGIDPAILAPLSGPGVVHFCGHRIGAGDRPPFAPEAEAAIARRISDVLQGSMPGYAYGSLASGADILWAEALLAGGAELHVVLPFAQTEFVGASVAPAGAGWVERFDVCLGKAASVRFATDDAFLGDEVLFRYCSELAMGLALLRGRYLDAEVYQLAIWDGQPAHGAAGTAIDVATWRRRRGRVTIVSPTIRPQVPEVIDVLESSALENGPDAFRPCDTALEDGPAQQPSHAAVPYDTRVVRAMLFGDVRGFSRLADEQLLIFCKRVLGEFATVLQRHRKHIWHCRAWGDAIFVVLTDAPTAAACALELQEAIASIDLASEGLPEHIALRLGGHLGPVFRYHDPIVDGPEFTGSHVSRAARIEPITPPGAVYVTEPFAAALVLAGRHDFPCDYVGHMPMAKDYGRLRMYRLRRVAPHVGER